MAGGVEKMSLDLARGLVSRGHQVTITSLDKPTKAAFYEWPAQVEWLRLGIGDPEKKANIGEKIQRIRKLRNLARNLKPDVGIGFQVGSFALLRISLLGMKIPVIAAERNAPTLFEFISGGKTKRFFANLLLLTAKRIAVQFSVYKDCYPRILRKKIRITPNWVRVPLHIDRTTNARVFNILFVGRLTFQKNIRVLLEAVKLIEFPYRLTIVGDGPDSSLLNSEVNNSASIYHSLPLIDLSSTYFDSDVLCLPSRWEGFPNVAAESLAHGTPVVGFSDCAGMQELIVPGKSGFFADGMNDPVSLHRALVLANEFNFNANDIVETVRGFTYDNFIDSWEICIKDCL